MTESRVVPVPRAAGDVVLDEVRERLADVHRSQERVADLLDALLNTAPAPGPVPPGDPTPSPEQLAVSADRDRIARDLHDHVVQQVFAACLSLQSVLPRVADPAARRRIAEVVEQLDGAVHDLRTTIFDLHTRDAAGGGLRRRLLDVVTATAGALSSTVRVSGVVDDLVVGSLAADVEAVAREAVSNCVRHAGGRHVTVTLDVTSEVVLEVADDGHGIDPRAARSGLRDLAERAQRRGGGLTVTRRPGGGTCLRWWAPLG
ncbi:histidine kinase-like protein [Geodermatophilus normandii]|uniref:Histidine kinase-like protein n=1 Tax=Geodermatophilus normandii TaxID=1137989 RepID=A0A317QME9_9ACTN|nr:histidine kinase [Geodermatophilus normandii]PWW24808.1 histidine kinase-like protein [Geodermatophilus normandii]